MLIQSIVYTVSPIITFLLLYALIYYGWHYLFGGGTMIRWHYAVLRFVLMPLAAYALMLWTQHLFMP